MLMCSQAETYVVAGHVLQCGDNAGESSLVRDRLGRQPVGRAMIEAMQGKTDEPGF